MVRRWVVDARLTAAVVAAGVAVGWLGGAHHTRETPDEYARSLNFPTQRALCQYLYEVMHDPESGAVRDPGEEFDLEAAWGRGDCGDVKQ
jgi:hypothetical protein